MALNWYFNMCKALCKLADDLDVKTKQCHWPGCENLGVQTVLDSEHPGMYCGQHFSLCKSCGRPYDGRTFRGLDRVEDECRNCFAKHNFICERCGENSWKPLVNIKENDKGLKICEKCLSNSGKVVCPSCKEIVEEDDLVERYKDDGWNPETKSRNKKLMDLGCTSCRTLCKGCQEYFPEDEVSRTSWGDKYCEECYSEKIGHCEECNAEDLHDDMVYVEIHDHSGEYCQSCYSKTFGTCHQCGEVCPQNNLHEEMSRGRGTGKYYCEECRPNFDEELPEEYKNLELPHELELTTFDRHINKLLKLVPISVKQLRTEHPGITTALKDLIGFSKGQDLNQEMILDWYQKQQRKSFEAKYTTWNSNLQTSLEDGGPQLVINLVVPEARIQQMEQEQPAAHKLFTLINSKSKESGHPMVENQMGWARLELHPEEKYILVEEIQTDHMNTLDRINYADYDDEYVGQIKTKYSLSDTDWLNTTKYLKSFIKEFPDAIIKAIEQFAKANGYNKLYWHTFESGRKLKRNNPPKSLYTQVPERHYFKPTEEKPFDLDGQFYAREARAKLPILTKLAESFYRRVI